MTPNVYMVKGAARALGVSVRYLRKLSAKIGKQTSPMGSRQVLLYTDRDLQRMQEARRG